MLVIGGEAMEDGDATEAVEWVESCCGRLLDVWLSRCWCLCWWLLIDVCVYDRLGRLVQQVIVIGCKRQRRQIQVVAVSAERCS